MPPAQQLNSFYFCVAAARPAAVMDIDALMATAQPPVMDIYAFASALGVHPEETAARMASSCDGLLRTSKERIDLPLSMMDSPSSSGPEGEQRGSTATRPTCEHSPVPSKDLVRKRGCPTPRTTALGGKKQKLAVLAAIEDCTRTDAPAELAIVDCARTDALAELLCSHAASGNLAGVREVLAEGADVNRGIYKGSASEGDLREITPLQHACIQGDEACVLAIIEAGADLDKVSMCGTALHAAANRGHEACVRMLIKEGANVDLTSWTGDSPLFFACSHDYDAIITALLDANADPLIVDSKGYTAAHYGRALLPWITGKDGVKRRKALLEQPRVPVPWSREGHAGFPKPRREQAVALVRAGAVLCLATSNPGAFRKPTPGTSS